MTMSPADVSRRTDIAYDEKTGSRRCAMGVEMPAVSSLEILQVDAEVSQKRE